MHICNKAIEATRRTEFRAGKLHKCRIFFQRASRKSKVATKWLRRNTDWNRERGNTARRDALPEILTAYITQNAALEVREVLSLIHLDAVN